MTAKELIIAMAKFAPDSPVSICVNNSMIMREALEHCIFDYESSGIDEFIEKLYEDIFGETQYLKCWRKAKAALSSAPRNCDLPEVCKDPHRAWLDDADNWDEFGSPKLEIHDWLLAPAKATRRK